MPIYAYRCSTCGHAKDVLQKMSDPRLTVCPSCGAETFEKQVTAAGFQLKGSGWYVTDFRGGNNSRPAAESSEGDGSASAKGEAPTGESADKPAGKKTDAGSSDGSASGAGASGDKSSGSGGGTDVGKSAGKSPGKGGDSTNSASTPSTGGTPTPPAASK